MPCSRSMPMNAWATATTPSVVTTLSSVSPPLLPNSATPVTINSTVSVTCATPATTALE